MGLEAIALLKIPYKTIAQEQQIEPAASASEALESMSTFIPLGDDGTAVVLDMPFDSSPEDLGVAVFSLIGESLEKHGDARGVLIVPERGFGQHASYEAAVDYFGDAGQWVPKPNAAQVQGAMARQVQSMMGGDLGGAIAQMQSQLALDPNMLASLGAAGGGDLFTMAQQLLTQMSPEQQAQLQEMAQSMFGNLDPSALGKPPSAEEEDPEFGGADAPKPTSK